MGRMNKLTLLESPFQTIAAGAFNSGILDNQFEVHFSENCNDFVSNLCQLLLASEWLLTC